MLRGLDARVRFPERTFATVDHIVPTLDQRRPFADDLAEQMMTALERNCREFGIPLYDLTSEQQGIVHVIGPELGLTQPGMTSHAEIVIPPRTGRSAPSPSASARRRCGTCWPRSASRSIRFASGAST